MERTETERFPERSRVVLALPGDGAPGNGNPTKTPSKRDRGLRRIGRRRSRETAGKTEGGKRYAGTDKRANRYSKPARVGMRRVIPVSGR